ncbi:MAG: hypothetical protein AAGD34_22995, partial [Pseudomonadota bacterium]
MSRRRPTVFEIDDVTFEETPEEAAPEPPRPRRRQKAAEEPAPDPLEAEVSEEAVVTVPPPARRKTRISWLSIFATGLSGLAALALSLSLYAFVDDLFARVPALGGLALVLAVLTAVGLLGMVFREWLAMRRLKEVEALR